MEQNGPSQKDIQSNRLSRRSFLTGAALGAAGTLVVREAASRINKQSDQCSANELRELEKAKISEFSGILTEARYMESTFLTRLSAFDLIVRATEASAGTPNVFYSSETVKYMQPEGWGTQMEQASDIAVTRLAGVDFAFSGSNLNKDLFMTNIKLLSKEAPAYAVLLSMPESPVIVNDRSDGHVRYNNSEGPGSVKEIKLYGGGDNDTQWFILLHEAQHAMDVDWYKVRNLIPRRDFIRYVQSSYEYVNEIASLWFRMPAEDAMKIFYDAPLSRLWGDEEKMAANNIDAWEKAYGVATEGSLAQRFNAVSHRVGAALLSIQEQRDKGVPLDTSQQDFITNQNTKDIMRIALDQIYHMSLDPVMGENGKFPHSISDLPEDSWYVTAMRLRVQKMRLQAFSQMKLEDSIGELTQRLLGRKNSEFERGRVESTYEKAGFEYKGYGEWGEDKAYEIYELPLNPLAPGKQQLFIAFQDRTHGDPYGCVLEFNRGRYDGKFPRSFDKASDGYVAGNFKVRLSPADPVEFTIASNGPDTKILPTVPQDDFTVYTVHSAPEIYL